MAGVAEDMTLAGDEDLDEHLDGDQAGGGESPETQHAAVAEPSRPVGQTPGRAVHPARGGGGGGRRRGSPARSAPARPGARARTTAAPRIHRRPAVNAVTKQTPARTENPAHDARQRGRFDPESVRVTSRAVQVGGVWAATVTVTGYPREVFAGWLAPLSTHPAMLDVSLHIGPLDPIIAATRLRRRLARLESGRRFGAEHGRLADPVVEAATEDAYELADRVARGEGRLFTVTMTMTVHAPTREQLDAELAALRALTTSLLMVTRPTTWRAWHGWVSGLPVGIDRIGGGRVMDTAALAAAFPFTSPDLPTPTTPHHQRCSGRSRRGSSRGGSAVRAQPGITVAGVLGPVRRRQLQRGHPRPLRIRQVVSGQARAAALAVSGGARPGHRPRRRVPAPGRRGRRHPGARGCGRGADQPAGSADPHRPRHRGAHRRRRHADPAGVVPAHLPGRRPPSHPHPRAEARPAARRWWVGGCRRPSGRCWTPRSPSPTAARASPTTRPPGTDRRRCWPTCTPPCSPAPPEAATYDSRHRRRRPAICRWRRRRPAWRPGCGRSSTAPTPDCSTARPPPRRRGIWWCGRYGHWPRNSNRPRCCWSWTPSGPPSRTRTTGGGA